MLAGLYRTWSGTCFEGSDAIKIRLLIRLASRLRTSSDNAEYTGWSGEADLAPWGARQRACGRAVIRHAHCRVINSEPRDELFLREEALPPSRAPDQSPSGGWMKNADDDDAWTAREALHRALAATTSSISFCCFS